MPKYSLLFYRKDCMGCHACEVACKQEHRLGVGPRLVRVEEKSSDFFPVYCHHCTRAPCKEACPVEAISRDANGAVLIDNEVCIGCRECLEACPFGAMQFDDEQEVAIKCDMCTERLSQGLTPACYSVCPTRCIAWGGTGAITEKLVNEALPRSMR
ncbi:MAG: 4Fe-4S dicluster domain-containing protein [Desulfohalobiaceae bacterium]|nr:4Fe-4S dicluster domain-containing protein [Desulfohalobiaceae bacterium]